MSLLSFSEKVKSYLKAAGCSQKILAHSLGLDPTVLNHKLNATGRTILTYPEVREIIRHLVRLEVITNQSQALELLAVIDCPSFSPDEWKVAPLNKLERDRQVTGSETVPKPCNPSNQTNLPVQLTNFIGRERELAKAPQLLANNHLLTLTGPGGTGKTRLALQVAKGLTGIFQDGVWLVELAPLSNSKLVVQAVGFVLGIKEEIGQSLLTTLTKSLRSKQILLVLDNCEHLLDETARIVEALLRSCPDLRVIVTSRERLCISGELILPIPPLSLPYDLQHSRGIFPDFVARLSRYEAVELFIDRALKIQPGFKLTPLNAQAVMQICCRLDGIPLAIELAVSRLTSLTVEQISERLDDRFKLLTTGSRTASPRQKTLKGVIEWSYNLLQEEEKLLFRILATFPCGCDMATAEKICCGEGLDEELILDLLFQLVNKSLIIKEEIGAKTRYRMLETIREYGQERVKEASELNVFLDKQLNYFLDLAEKAAGELEGPEQIQWLECLEIEHDNLRQLLNWALNQENPDRGLKLGIALRRFWHIRGYNYEAQQWLEQVLTLRHLIPKALQAKVLIWASILNDIQSEFNKGYLFCQEAIAICRETGNLVDLSWALNSLGVIANHQGNVLQAAASFEEGHQVCQQLGDRTGIAVMLDNLGGIALDKGDFISAELHSKKALAIYTSLNNNRGQIQSLAGLATITLRQGEFVRATQLAEEGMRLNKEVKDKRINCYLTDILSIASEHQGNVSTARKLYLEALVTRQELHDKPGIAVSLEHLGKLAISEGQVRRGGWFLGAAETLLKEIAASKRLEILLQYKDAVVSKNNKTVADSFSSAWQEGNSIPLDELIAF